MVYSPAPDNPMGLIYVSRTREPPPESGLDYILDPEVHEAYRGFVYYLCCFSWSIDEIFSLRLRTVLKDPRDQQPPEPVTMRREKRVTIELALNSDSHPFNAWGWAGIQLPKTRSVKPAQQPFSGRLLRLSTQVLGCTMGASNAQPCNNCWLRELRNLPPNLQVQPYMIDFQAESQIIPLSKPSHGNDKCLKAEIMFHFTCYSRHHGGIYG